MRKLSIPFILLTILIGTAWSSTKVVTTWKDPNIPKPTFNKIAIAFPHKDPSLRQRVEDGIVRRMSRPGVATHTFVSDTDLTDRETLKARLASNGVDGLVLLRLLNVDEDKIVALGDTRSVYPSLWDACADPLNITTASYSYTSRIVTADLTIYSVATAKPVWIGRIKSTDPKHLKGLLDELVKASASELKKQKLI